MTQPGQPLYGLETTNNGRVVNFAGGIPLMRDGEVAGAIGPGGRRGRGRCLLNFPKAEGYRG
jgi:uncharacterized protein GlcG (DUF336 family)